MAAVIAPKTIVIVDDHPIVCEGVKALLENDPHLRVVGTAGSILEACETIRNLRPNVVLLDVELDAVSSIDHIEEIIACSPDSKILLLTGAIDEKANDRAAERGAMGIVSKNDAPATLVMAVKKVSEGEVWFDRVFTARVLQNLSRRNTAERKAYDIFASLTSRECEIAMKIGQGLVNKDIARELGISEKTVRNSLTTVYEKLGVASRLELAVFLSKNHVQQSGHLSPLS